MSEPPVPQWRTAQEEFLHLLSSEWTRKVACQRQCTTQTGTCKCHIIHVHELESWMRRSASDDASSTKPDSPGTTTDDPNTKPSTKGERLLQEVHHKAKQYHEYGFPLLSLSSRLLTGENRCVLVFSLLLSQGRGHLIDLFYRSKMYDRELKLRHNQYQANHPILRDTLRSRSISDEEIDKIIADFEEAKWAYCSPHRQFTLHMEGDFEGTEILMPYCKQTLISHGGTASVYWVAVQKDLITDTQFREALNESLYSDEDFGQCYQMALKTYHEMKTYEDEKLAFSGLPKDLSLPIVRYLGCYTHDYKDHGTHGKSYNLLLEYGEKDLEEYWADLTNVPPVQATEIIRFWESLFDVAIAIRTVHNLQIFNGKSAALEYIGIHADIKPDNILRVHGRFKLADFGFSRFAEKGGTPTLYVDGGTQTYGAPEVARMDIHGTRSEVTRSIDTWSFGCVLSTAATWVVLGYQGILQYRKLRERAPGTKAPHDKRTDRFHNLTDPLPEIGCWHNYLRGHIRKGDTTTLKVLDLVELRMLRVPPKSRIEFKELCPELERLIRSARRDVDDLGSHTREIDHAVLEALLAVENQAQECQTSGAKNKPLELAAPPNNPAKGPVHEAAWHIPTNPSQRATMRSRKVQVLDSIPLGQTAHRKEVLEEKLSKTSIISDEIKHPTEEYHNGATTDSPTGSPQSTPLSRPMKPTLKNIAANGRDGRLTLPESDVPLGHQVPVRKPSRDSPQSRTSTSARAEKIDQGQEGYINFASSVHPPIDDTTRSRARGSKPLTLNIPDQLPESYMSSHTSSTTSAGLSPGHRSPVRSVFTAHSDKAGDSGRQIPAEGMTYERTAGSQPATPDNPQQSDRSGEYATNRVLFSLETNTETLSRDGSSHSPLSPLSPLDDRVPSGLGLSVNSSGGSPVRDESEEATSRERQIPTAGFPMPSPASPIVSYEPQSHGVKTAINGTPPSQPTVVTPGASQQAYENQSSKSPLLPEPVVPQNPVPSTVYEFPFDVCQQRRKLDEIKPKKNSLGKFGTKMKTIMRREIHEKDDHLARFITNREIIFVVDNGTSMAPHWHLVHFLVETLAKKLAGLDESGIDLRFTIQNHGQSQDKSNLRGEYGRKEIRKAMHQARPKMQTQTLPTDMDQTLRNVFNEWRSNGQRPTTLLVFTDGIWEGTADTVERKLVEVLKQVQRTHQGSNHYFTIQFVRFGDDSNAKERLQRCDDELCKNNDLDDVIDHCTWTDPVDKIILGSLSTHHDKKVASIDSESCNYDQGQLLDLFDRFNSDTLLPPGSGLLRSPSPGSSMGTRSDTDRSEGVGTPKPKRWSKLVSN